MIILAAEALIVIFSSWILTKKYFCIRSFSESILIGFLLFFAQIVLVELLLGSLNQLYYQNVFIAHAAILLAVALAYSKQNLPLFEKPDLRFFISSNLLIFAFSVFTAFFTIKAFYNLVNPPLSPDSLQFHLAYPATWIVNANLDNPFFVFGASPIVHPGSLETSSLSYYPINAQLFFTWLMLPLRNAFLADLGEAPFYIIGIIAIYAILKSYNVNRKVALLSGFLWALIPNIFKQLRTGSLIDVICSVLFIMVFYTLLLLKNNFTIKNAVLFGISLGLLIGTKIINFVWLLAFLPFICFVLLEAAKTNRLAGVRLIGFFSLIASMIILFGGFMYIKNLYLTGNPLFPVSLKVFGKTFFPGLLDNAGYKIQIASGDKFELMKVLFREGLGVQFLALILPCTFAPIFFYGYLKKKFRPLGEYLLLFITPLLMLFFYRTFVNIYWTRYFFPYLSLGLLTAVIFISRFKRLDKYLSVVSFVSIFAAAFELAKGHELVLSIMFSLALFAVFAFYKKTIGEFYKSKNFNRSAVAILALGILLLNFLSDRYDKEEFQRYPLSFSKKEAWQIDMGKGWQALNKESKQGGRVAYAGRAEFYPLFGEKLKNNVIYVSVNAKEASPYNNPDGLIRQVKDFPSWMDNLKKERIDYLFVALPCSENREVDDPTKFPIEDEWAGGHPGEFRLLFRNSLSHIYKVSIR